MEQLAIVSMILFLAIPGSAQTQQSGIKRTELQRHDLSVTGRETIQARIDFDPELHSVNTHIRAKRLSMSSKAYWNTRLRASHR